MSVAVAPTAVRPFAMFRVQVSRVTRISPRLVRLTFTGPDLHDLADIGYDQRIKLVLASATGTLADMPTGDDWFGLWRLMDTDRRPVIRTYTVRAVRSELAEVDVDMVDHGDTGPASAFAGTARPGDEVLLYGPHAAYLGEPGGMEFRTDLAGVTDQLIVGDESAVPAVASILERLPEHARGLACLEVGAAEDVLDLRTPPGVTLTWCIRGPERGERQREAVRAWLDDHAVVGASHSGTSTVVADGEDSAYWEVTTDRGADVPPLSAWIAGESSVVRAMRRLLVGEYDVPRSAVAFMGYWREGHREC
ncbi:siderophore-interacting protein [Luteipulveratus sp. YIM 133132]|uniref:siderophore-interacting protein n=1 Tax=Luteipulveratus flavus TaxID=3031728 RepID=UPI0023B15FE1|nr:siderophore-interacting protein [Luteipulveratus sp. YIM 133132]MDE9364532.1 siderophore-interacting protein [Luteipulveratus sp. YIM 133132]